MRSRTLVGIAALTIVVAACSGDDTELTPGSTLITGGPGSTAAPTTIVEAPSTTAPITTSTLVGQDVEGFEVVASIPNDDGVTQYIVIPHGAYTDVDLENFVIGLLEGNAQLYGAEIFDSAEAAVAFEVAPGSRTTAEQELIDRHHFVTLVGRDFIEFNGPFSEFPGGALGS